MSSSRNSRTIALIVACAFFMENLDATVIATALPAMAESFGTSPTALSIGMTAYLLALAVFIPVSGWVADRYGTRTVFCSAIGVFTIASVLCGASEGLWTFTGARILQGASAAMMSPVGRLVVLKSTPKSELLGAIALITWPALVAPVLGPPIGGFLATYASWRWIFFLNVPIGLLGVTLVARYLPNLYAEERRRFDFGGFALTAAALGCLIFALDLFARGDGQWIAGSSLLAAGAALTAIAVRHARRVPHPLVNLATLRIPTFALSSLWAGSLFRLTSGAMPFLLPLFFQIGFGMNAFAAGLLVLAYAGGNLGMKTITTPVLKRFGFRNVLIVNGLLAAAFILACAALAPGTPTPVIIVVLFAAGCFRSMQLTGINTLIFADVPAELRSAATTLSSMLHQLAMSFGIALGAIMLNVSAVTRSGDAHALTLMDFQIALAGMALIALLSVLRFLSMQPEAGAEVSGHRSRTKPAE